MESFEILNVDIEGDSGRFKVDISLSENEKITKIEVTEDCENKQEIIDKHLTSLKVLDRKLYEVDRELDDINFELKKGNDAFDIENYLKADNAIAVEGKPNGEEEKCELHFLFDINQEGHIYNLNINIENETTRLDNETEIECVINSKIND